MIQGVNRQAHSVFTYVHVIIVIANLESWMITTIMDIYDPSSAAYKKAKRQYIKTTKNRSKDIEWTPFRSAEKKYKARFPPPDLSHVLDLASTTSDAETLVSGCSLYCNGVEIKPLSQSESASPCVANLCKAFAVPSVPGARETSRGEIVRVTSVTRSRYTPIIRFLGGSATTGAMGSSRSCTTSQ